MKTAEWENCESCRHIVLSLLRLCVPSKLWTEDDTVRAHRMGEVLRSREENKPIIVRFQAWQDTMLVVASKSARGILWRSEITVDDHLTKRQR